MRRAVGVRADAHRGAGKQPRRAGGVSSVEAAVRQRRPNRAREARAQPDLVRRNVPGRRSCRSRQALPRAPCGRSGRRGRGPPRREGGRRRAERHDARSGRAPRGGGSFAAEADLASPRAVHTAHRQAHRSVRSDAARRIHRRRGYRRASLVRSGGLHGPLAPRSARGEPPSPCARRSESVSTRFRRMRSS